MYIRVGDRVRPPSRGHYVPAALGEGHVVGVIDCGRSLLFIPLFRVVCMYQVPGIVYLLSPRYALPTPCVYH